MRILHLLASPVFSGPAENVALLAAEQRALGHEVSVAVDRKRPGLEFEEPAAPRLAALGLLDEGGLELSVKSTPWAMARDVWRLRRREGVDVVHAHFSHDHLLARLGRPRGAALVRSIHHPRSLRPSTPRADAFTVMTPLEAQALRGRRVEVLPALVDPRFRPATDVAALRRELGVTGAPLVGMVSTFQASRRHGLGVEAFALVLRQHPDARLVLVGDGGRVDAVRAQVRERGLEERVRFVGYQQGDAFVRWVQALDQVWVLGLGNDWSGRAAAQARACGVRVVAVAEGALPQLADVVAEALLPRAVADAALSDGRAARAHPTNRAVAERMLALYAEVRG